MAIESSEERNLIKIRVSIGKLLISLNGNEIKTLST